MIGNKKINQVIELTRRHYNWNYEMPSTFYKCNTSEWCEDEDEMGKNNKKLEIWDRTGEKKWT